MAKSEDLRMRGQRALGSCRGRDWLFPFQFSLSSLRAAKSVVHSFKQRLRPKSITLRPKVHLLSSSRRRGAITALIFGVVLIALFASHHNRSIRFRLSPGCSSRQQRAQREKEKLRRETTAAALKKAAELAEDGCRDIAITAPGGRQYIRRAFDQLPADD